MKTRYLTIPMFVAAALAAPAGAQDLAQENAKLREALRNTTLQMREVQANADIANSAKDQAEAENQRLNTRLEEVMARLVREQDDNAAEIKRLGEENASLSLRVDQLSGNLAKWKDAYEETAKIARQKEGERVAAATKAAELEVTAANYLRANIGLYNTGNEILSRYESFGLGTAITAREPFVGTTRVKLQNYVQDFADKLDENRVHIDDPTGSRHSATDSVESTAGLDPASATATTQSTTSSRPHRR